MTTVLQQALGAAYESGQVMIVTGLSSHLPHHGESMNSFDTLLIRIILDHPGRKILILDTPDYFVRSVSTQCSGMHPAPAPQPCDPQGTLAPDAGRRGLAGRRCRTGAVGCIRFRPVRYESGSAPCRMGGAGAMALPASACYAADATDHIGTTRVLLDAARTIARMTDGEAPPLFG